MTSVTWSIGRTRATMPWEVETKTPLLRAAFTKIAQPPPSGACSLQVRAPEAAPTWSPFGTRGSVNSRVPRPSRSWGRLRLSSQLTIEWSGETASPKWVRNCRRTIVPCALIRWSCGPTSVVAMPNTPRPMVDH